MRLAQHHRLYTCFFIFSMATGAVLSRLPDVQHNMAVTESQLGMTLIGMAIGSLISLTFASPIIEQLGVRRTALITVLGTAALYCSLAFIHWAPLAFLALVAAGLLAGALEININVQLDQREAQLGRGIMSRAHGFWSLGFFVTSLVSAGVRQAGVPIEVHVGVVLLIVLVAGAVIISPLEEAPARVSTAVDEDVHRIAFPTWGLLPLCIIGMAAFLVEGAGVDWSTIYMRDVFAAAPFVGGMGLTLFTFFMAMARLFIDPIVDRYGARMIATILLGASALGLIAVAFAPTTAVALLGFSLLGLGCSAVYPLAVSAAAQRTDRPASVNVAAMGQVTFVIFFLAPPLLGFVAQYMGIRDSYLICLPLVFAALALVRSLPGRRDVPGGTPAVPMQG
ncbi:MFS transporter [Devosia sp. D6-9]|nr:MFS transporter [Devosia sp. D6-9]